MRKSSNLQTTLNPVCRPPKKNEQYISISEKKIVSLQKISIAKKRTRAETFYDKGSPPSGYSHKKNIRHGESRQDSEEQSMKKKMMMGFTANIQSVHGNRKRIMETFNDAKKTEDEQNKGRAAGCGADDTPVLQEEGGQRGVMPRMPRVATVRCSKTGTLQVWREQAYVQKVPHPLLSPSDERTNVQSDALGWTENDSAPSGCCHQACHERIVTTGNGHEWRICK